MLESRRCLLMTFVGAAGVLAVEPLAAALQSPGRASPQAHPYPNGRDPNVPPAMDEPRVPDPRAIELQNQRKLRSDVAKLYDMVSDFKDQLEKTDSNTTLAVPLVKKAQQIERLARQIKDLAKG